jgi:hypothetical protein
MRGRAGLGPVAVEEDFGSRERSVRPSLCAAWSFQRRVDERRRLHALLWGGFSFPLRFRRIGDSPTFEISARRVGIILLVVVDMHAYVGHRSIERIEEQRHSKFVTVQKKKMSGCKQRQSVS